MSSSGVASGSGSSGSGSSGSGSSGSGSSGSGSSGGSDWLVLASAAAKADVTKEEGRAVVLRFIQLQFPAALFLCDLSRGSFVEPMDSGRNWFEADGTDLPTTSVKGIPAYGIGVMMGGINSMGSYDVTPYTVFIPYKGYEVAWYAIVLARVCREVRVPTADGGGNPAVTEVYAKWRELRLRLNESGNAKKVRDYLYSQSFYNDLRAAGVWYGSDWTRLYTGLL